MYFKTFSTLTILATSTTFMTGCPGIDEMVRDAMADCNKAYDEGNSTLNAHFADALKCCLKRLPDDPAGYAACTRAVNDAKEDANDTMDDAHAACVSQNIEVLKATTLSIIAITQAAVKAACDTTKVFNVTLSNNGEYNNVAQTLDSPEEIGIELSGRALALHQLPDGSNNNTRYSASLKGTVTFAMDPLPLAMPTTVHLTMSLPQNHHEPGIVHSMRVEVAGGGVFESPESFQGSVYRNNEGRRVMNVVLVDASSSANGDDIPVGVALELPFTISGNRIRISTGGEMVATEQIAPVAPNAIADWHRDFTVDMTDYAFFMESFASGLCDLNGDGETDELDIEFFEERFWAEFEG